MSVTTQDIFKFLDSVEAALFSDMLLYHDSHPRFYTVKANLDIIRDWLNRRYVPIYLYKRIFYRWSKLHDLRNATMDALWWYKKNFAYDEEADCLFNEADDCNDYDMRKAIHKRRVKARNDAQLAYVKFEEAVVTRERLIAEIKASK